MSDRPCGPSAVALWLEAGGGTREFSRDRYRQLLRDHGMLVDGPVQPLPCGWTPGERGEPPEHRAARQRTADEHAALALPARVGRWVVGKGWMPVDGRGPHEGTGL